MSTTWTNISKPSVISWSNVPKPTIGNVKIISTGGSPIGLLLALTYTTTSSIITGGWTNISKANSTAWTNIPKAT